VRENLTLDTTGYNSTTATVQQEPSLQSVAAGVRRSNFTWCF